MATILIIEDDPLARDWLESLLSRNGYDIASASNGQAGYDLFCANPTDVVITDIVMPVKDGIEAITDLKRTHPAVKIIAISGGERRPAGMSQNYLHSAKLLGADRALQKPITNDALLNAVQDLLK